MIKTVKRQMKRFLNGLLSTNPISNFIVAIIYSLVYDYMYSNHIITVWGYAVNRPFQPLSSSDLFLYLLLASIPFVFYKGLKHFASAFSLFVYIFIYIPFTYSLFVHGFPDGLRYSYLLFFFIIMIVFFKTDRLSIFKKFIVHRRKTLPFKVIPVITVFLLVVLVTINRSQLHFVNFFEDSQSMYEFREDANIKLIYVLCWLRSALLPLLMLYYLCKSQWFKYGFTFLGFVLLFMLDQQKMTIIFPVAITAIFIAIKYYNAKVSSKFHLFLFLIFIIIPLFIVKYDSNPLSLVFSLIFIYRIQCMAGIQFQKYLDFFVIQDHPFTYYTHIGVVNRITGLYPYDMSIGEVINAGDGNSNATFFLMDGVAAAGLIGCIIVGILFLIVKSILNSLSSVYKVPLLTALFLFPLQSLMNVSLFTALVSHGIIVLFLILIFFDVKEFKIVNNNEEAINITKRNLKL